MLTYTGRRNLYGTLTNDSSSTNLTLGDTLMNEAEREIIGLRAWPFLEKTYVQSTVANQQFYQIPNEIEKVLAVTVTVGTIQYTPTQAPSVDFWNYINTTTNVTSNIPDWWYVQDGRIGFYPIPADTTSNAITITGRRRQVDLNKADYTTGTIVTATNGSTAIVGSGTSWTAGMKGSYLRITAGNAAGLGDNQWYEIASIDSSTALTLVKPYAGVSIAAGSAAYTLGQSGLLPEDYDILPVYKAAWHYYAVIQPMPANADRFEDQYNKRMKDMVQGVGRRSDNPVIVNVSNISVINPNLTLTSPGM